jgi:acyl dehydratase
MSRPDPIPPATHVERLKEQRVSTFTQAGGAAALNAPDTPLLEVPSVTDRFRYARAYWTSTLRNLTVTHALKAQRVGTYASPVVISPALRAQWQQLFNATGDRSDPDVPVPYLYNQSVGTLLYTRLIADLGINFRHLLHVQHETKHWASVTDWVNTDRQELHASLRGAARLGDGKAMISLRIAIHRPRADGGALLGTVNDRFIIRNVPDADLQQLASGRALLRTLAELRRKEPQLDATASDSVAGTLHVPADMGKRFGRVSGDFNPVHTTRWAARLFGVKRPFLQGLGLRNAMIRQLALHARPLKRFTISFASPAFLGQTLRVVMQGDAFELIDESGLVVAFGAGNATT